MQGIICFLEKGLFPTQRVLVHISAVSPGASQNFLFVLFFLWLLLILFLFPAPTVFSTGLALPQLSLPISRPYLALLWFSP